MLKGFKEFLFRGNIVDLAVAVVIGTAFVALVTAFSTYFVRPIIARVGGDAGFGFGIQLGEDGNDATFIDIGAFITACLTFMITAVIVYFLVVVPMKRATDRYALTPQPVAVPADVQLLTEIRDLLQQQGGGTGSTGAQTVPPPSG